MGQHDGRLQVPEEQETAHGQADLLRVLGDARSQVQGDVVLAGGVVGLQAAAAAHVGIDRYLYGFAASTLPADQVNDGLASLVADELGGFRGYFKLGGHVVHSVHGLAVPRRVGVEIPAGDIAPEGGAELLGTVHLQLINGYVTH